MRTINDVEAAFAELAHTAPSADVLRLPTEPPRNRRRWPAPVAAAVAMIAVVVGVVAVTSSDKPTPPAVPALHSLRYPAANESVDTTIHFTADLPSAVTASRAYSVDRGSQHLEFLTLPATKKCVTSGDPAVVNPYCRRLALVTLFYVGTPTASDDGGFDPADVDHLARQDVNGRQGFYGAPRVPAGIGAVDDKLADGSEAVHLFWKYSKEGWAEVIAKTRGDALSIARSVRPASTPLTVPLREKLPESGYVNTLSAEPGVRFGGYDVAPSLVTAYWGETPDYGGNAGITAPHDEVIDGRTWRFDTINDDLRARLVGAATPITLTGYQRMPKARMRDFIQRLEFASDLTDRGTWFRASSMG